jgi:hypothetical protein
MRYWAAVGILALASAAHGACPAPQIYDRATGNALGALVSPLAFALPPGSVSQERATYVQTVLTRAPVREVCPVEERIVFNAGATIIEQKWGDKWHSAGIRATLWPIHREIWKQKNGKWVDVSPKLTREEIEARWLERYQEAVTKLAAKHAT